ncbi:MAG: hypothetical protein ACYSWO_26380 [Planctomycetota bacterium]
MLECEFKHKLGAVNLGLVVCTCQKHGNKIVSDSICRDCPDRVEPEDIKDLETDFLEREPEEVERLFSICQSCPLLTAGTHRCKGKPGEPLPIDTVAQNPANHCPENKW